MIKKKNIFIFLIVLGLLFTTYLLLSSEPVDKQIVKDSSNRELNITTTEYVSQFKVLVNNYRQAVMSDELDALKVKTIREDILALVVPTQYKDLHVQIVLALIKMEEFIKGADQSYKIESNNLINEALANNNWLETE